MIPLALYLHFPWCLRKCPYCDFNSYQLPVQHPGLFAQYLEALLMDLAHAATLTPTNILSSIYFGGGTPSLLPIADIKTILQHIKKYFLLASNIEITIEANPGTINLAWLQELSHLGINRISLGVQSFNDQKLQALGRIHTAKQAQDAIAMIKLAGLTNFNLDLMFGLPGQDAAEAMLDLQTALSFEPPHLSWYQLTLEPGTCFARKPPQLPASEILWDIQQCGQDPLKQHDLHQYEVSAYSKIKHECRHNINYWQYGDYLGIGAGAHGKITSSNHIIRRTAKIANPMQYIHHIANHGVEQEEIVATKKIPFEFMLNSLRLYQPITLALFQERTGVTIDTIMPQLQLAQELGLIELNADKIITTEHGKNFLNNLLELFL